MEAAVRDRIHALWDELSEYSAADIDSAMRHLLHALAGLLDAKQAFWFGAVRLGNAQANDPIQGWRPRTLRYLYPSKEHESTGKATASLIEAGEIDPNVIANLRGAGSFRINIKHEIVPPHWFQSNYYLTYYAPLKIQDVIYVVTPLGPDIESWFGFERISDEPSHFGDAEREIVDYAIRPLRWFHHDLMLHHGLLLADKPLSDAERRVLNGLLSSRTEQEIADELGLSQKTVHTYCTRICRKFGVRGRTGLTALWLGQLPGKE